MADHYSANITIGGALTPAALADLIDAVTADAAGVDYGCAITSAAEAEAAARDAISEQRCLDLCDDSASWGRFDAIEACATQHGLPFRRTCEAKYEYDGEVVYFDGTALHNEDANQSGDPIVTLDALKEAHSKGTVADLIARLSVVDSPIPPLTPPPIVSQLVPLKWARLPATGVDPAV